jgi:GrpB-like predicted nucleotidyltransferase (UPF0157 family)
MKCKTMIETFAAPYQADVTHVGTCTAVGTARHKEITP